MAGYIPDSLYLFKIYPAGSQCDKSMCCYLFIMTTDPGLWKLLRKPSGIPGYQQRYNAINYIGCKELL